MPFTSADGAFGFHYAAELVKCETQDAKVTSESSVGAGGGLSVQRSGRSGGNGGVLWVSEGKVQG